MDDGDVILASLRGQRPQKAQRPRFERHQALDDGDDDGGGDDDGRGDDDGGGGDDDHDDMGI